MAEARRLSALAAEVASAADFPDGPLAVALSGGADSAALLWTCVRLGRQVRALHVHHRLAASDLMQEAAEAVASAMTVELNVLHVEVGGGASAENQARRVRYGALAEAAVPGEWILTGHTSDDQAETVVDHFLRSSGLDGLRGIPARRPPFARPLLAVARSQTRELATLAGLAWRDDPANEDDQPLRNRIRRRLIPDLEAAYNPRLRESLAMTAALVARDTAFLDSFVDSVPITVRDGRAEVAAAALSTAPPVVAARLARRFLAVAGLPAASAAAVAGVLEVAAGTLAGHQPGASIVVGRRRAMVVAGLPGDAGPWPSATLEVPGSSRYGDWRFEAIVADTPPQSMPIGAAWMVADAAALGPLRIEPAAGHPGVVEHLAQGGVPSSERDAYPVVTADHGPVWIPMVRRLDAGWVAANTDRYLVVFARVDSTCRR